VFGYVLEGEYEWAIDDQPAKKLKKLNWSSPSLRRSRAAGFRDEGSASS
jgi:hypothetical protein